MLISFDLGKSAANILYKIALKIDSVIYSLVNYLYKLFLILSRTRIINESVISPIIKRVYIILGVVMLFVLAYSLLKAIVNPATKDKSSAGKTVASVIKAVILMAIIPTIFDFAYQFQDAILSQNTIGKLILGVKSSEQIEYGNTSAGTIKELINGGGMEMATSVLKAFIVPTDSNNPNPTIGDLGLTYDNIWERTQQEGDFSSITKFSSELAKQEDESQSDYEEQYIDYSVLISTFAGAFIAWMLGGYCLSLGKRVIKLAFMEIIAPVPVILSVIPSKAQTLKDWIKDAVTLYIEVFLRITILYISVYLISKINIAFNHDSTTIFGFEAPIRYTFMAKAIIIMGLIAFCKSAPELIGKYFGVKTDNLQNGIRNQLKEGGLFAAGGMALGSVGSIGRKITASGRKWKARNAEIKENDPHKKRKQFGNAMRGLGGMLGGVVTGGIIGGINGYNKDASKFSDIISSGVSASQKYGAKLDEKEQYLRTHGGHFLPKFKKGEGKSIFGIKDENGIVTQYRRGENGHYYDADGNELLGNRENLLHYYDSQGRITDSSGYLLDDSGNKIFEKGVALGHASYAFSGLKEFVGFGDSIEKLTKQIDVLNSVMSSSKSLNDAIMNKIVSEANKGKSDLHTSDNKYSATVLKALDEVLKQKNAGQEITKDMLKATLASYGCSFGNGETVHTYVTGLKPTDNIDTAGFLESFIGTYKKNFTDILEDEVLSGKKDTLYACGVSKELGTLRDAIAAGFRDASELMEKAGYSLADASSGLSVETIKKHNKYSESGDKSLEAIIDTAISKVDKLKKEKANDAGKKSDSDK